MTQYDLFEVMQQRQSVRKYDQDVAITKEDLETILEAAGQAPSSWNLQHWKFLVIESKEQKEALHPIAFYQDQVLEASAIIAVLGDLKAYENTERVTQEAVQNGYMSEEAREKLKGNILGAYEKMPNFAQNEAILNPSLASMNLMLAAKAKGYDTCPMGGFNRDAFKEHFNVPERYYPVMLISVGKARESAHSTTRFSVDEIMVSETF